MLFIGFLGQMVVDTYKRPSTCTWVMGNGKKQGFVGLDLPQHQDHPRWEKVKTKTFLFWVSVLRIRRLTVNFIYLHIHMCSAPRPSYQGCSAPDFDLNICLWVCHFKLVLMCWPQVTTLLWSNIWIVASWVSQWCETICFASQPLCLHIVSY